jgi:hypothetical protein
MNSFRLIHAGFIDNQHLIFVFVSMIPTRLNREDPLDRPSQVKSELEVRLFRVNKVKDAYSVREEATRN